MKKRAIAVLVIILTLLVSACSSDNTATDTNNNSTGGTKEFNKEELNIAMPAAPPNLDPHLSVAAVTGQVVLNMFETLVTFDENYEVQPSLAEKIEISEDGKTYTFPLRDITFHDGEKLTAADVIASLERWGRLSPVGRNAMADVELEEQDEQTVVMKLKQASNTILYDLAYPTSQAAYILPKKIIDKFGD
ncbi:MAG: ABC transporter substrate-binding protein, partial [Niallia sp.]